MFNFTYKGSVEIRRGNPTFDIVKFGLGKYSPSTLYSGEEEQNGYHFSVQFMDTLFEKIKVLKRITIVKKHDSLTDRGIKEALKKHSRKKFMMYFSKTADDGVNYFHKNMTIFSAYAEYNTLLQDSGENFSVFTITGKKVVTSPILGMDGTVDINSLED